MPRQTKSENPRLRARRARRPDAVKEAAGALAPSCMGWEWVSYWHGRRLFSIRTFLFQTFRCLRLEWSARCCEDWLLLSRRSMGLTFRARACGARLREMQRMNRVVPAAARFRRSMSSKDVGIAGDRWIEEPGLHNVIRRSSFVSQPLALARDVTGGHAVGSGGICECGRHRVIHPSRDHWAPIVVPERFFLGRQPR